MMKAKNLWFVLIFSSIIASLNSQSSAKSEDQFGSHLFSVPSASAPRFDDDGDAEGLKNSLASSLTFYANLPPETTFYFGAEAFNARQMAQSVQSILDFLKASTSTAQLCDFIQRDFLIYRSTAPSVSSPTVTFSAYYEHSLKASLVPTAEYRFPIYGRPTDLVDVEMGNFDPSRKGERVVGRVETGKLIPYYSRKEIDSDKALKGKGLEIAWTKDPLDILFLQIQGSGWIQIPDSTATYHIRYAGDNGLPFRSVGLYLIESGAIPRAEFSRAKMIDYMKKLSDDKKQSILNQNPRYIFFEIVSSTNLTRGSLMVPLTAGRSVATDPKFYPQGALAWIRTERPLFDAQGNLKGRNPLTRFVLNQDEGGAIKGPGRVDFFVGGGAEAEWTAQKLWYPGDLYFFIKKPNGGKP